MKTEHTLVLVRHGRTEWADQNRFAGWADAPLSKAGLREANSAGLALAKAGYRFDACQTSRLSRATRTLKIILGCLGQETLPVEQSWRLNERHYGRLQGFKRTKMALEHGNEQVLRWRRSYTARPPALADDDPRLAALDPLYKDVDPTVLPRSESLQDAALRVGQYWREHLAPQLRESRTMLIVAHTSSLRGLAIEIEGLDSAAAEAFRIATAVPVVYRLDNALRVVEKHQVHGDWPSRVRSFVNRHKPGARVSWI